MASLSDEQIGAIRGRYQRNAETPDTIAAKKNITPPTAHDAIALTFRAVDRVPRPTAIMEIAAIEPPIYPHISEIGTLSPERFLNTIAQASSEVQIEKAGHATSTAHAVPFVIPG
jgi:hypothetical protein